MKTIKVKAWGRWERAFAKNGRVYVWDSVAGHYTTCHSLSHAVCMRIVRLAYN
jgi:hypothetical protein